MKNTITLFAFALSCSVAGYAQTYCTPEGLDCSNGDGPNYFQLTGEESTEIAYDNAECDSDAYFDYSASTGAKLYSGSDYTFDIQSGQPSQALSIWIDFNNDGTFDDDERVVNEDTFGNAVTTLTMTIPAATAAGTYRMRVMGVYDDTSGEGALAATFPMAPCNLDEDGNQIYSNGKTIDFFADIAADPLPVGFSRFTATLDTKGVQLAWTTLSEEQNKGFYIERSPDAISWTTIGLTPSKASINGTSKEPLDYGFTDVSPLKGLNMYRLKQVDFDGKFSYSPVRKLVSGSSGMMLVAYPNPSGNQVTIDGLAGNERIRIFNTTGTAVLTLQTRATKEQVDISSLPPGQYIIQVTDIHGHADTKRITKTGE